MQHPFVSPVVQNYLVVSQWQKTLSFTLKVSSIVSVAASTFSFLLVPSLHNKANAQVTSAKVVNVLRSADALTMLDELEVKGRAPKTGYSRSAFGPSWSDVDRNGCDTRNDILKRDLVNITFRAKTRDCVIETGILRDPFSGESINFLRGEKTSFLVQIDHVVSLSNSWQTGMFQMNVKVRTAFANDPLNLLAVKGSLNSQKGDGDAATWLPPNKSFRCEYVSRQVEVKKKYGLWVTKPEKEAIARILNSSTCQKKVG